MEKSITITCHAPDDFRYWLERQTQDADARTFPIRGGQFSLDWPRVQQQEPMVLVMDGTYSIHRGHRIESHGVPEAIKFELRKASSGAMVLTAKYDADMPAARRYFEDLLGAIESNWATDQVQQDA